MSIPIPVSGGSVASRQLSNVGESRDSEDMTSLTSRRDVPRDCAPVPHDTLWLRLNLEPQQVPSAYEDSRDEEEDGDYIIAQAPARKSASDLVVNRRKSSPSTRHRRHVEQVNRQRTQRLATDDALLPGSTEELPTRNSTVHRIRHQSRRHRRNATRRKQKNDEGVDSKSDVEPMSGSEPWHCQMEPHWQRQREGTFPPFLQTGRCRQKRCVSGYECRPRKYAARVLRRLPGRCNPLPLVGDNAATAFEEAWVVEEVRVTVGCECTRRRTAGVYGVLTGGNPRWCRDNQQNSSNGFLTHNEVIVYAPEVTDCLRRFCELARGIASRRRTAPQKSTSWSDSDHDELTYCSLRGVKSHSHHWEIRSVDDAQTSRF